MHLRLRSLHNGLQFRTVHQASFCPWRQRQDHYRLPDHQLLDRFHQRVVCDERWECTQVQRPSRVLYIPNPWMRLETRSMDGVKTVVREEMELVFFFGSYFEYRNDDCVFFQSVPQFSIKLLFSIILLSLDTTRHNA